MTFPTPRFRVYLDDDPLAPTTGTDLSSRVESISYDYGKQSALDEFQPGSLSTRLKNDDRALDPLNTSSPYNGKLKPRKRCDFALTYNGTTYDQYTGFLGGWPQSYAQPAMSYADLRAADLFVLLANIDLPATVWLLEASADACWAWWRLNETSGSTFADSSGHKRDATFNYTRIDNIDNPPTLPSFAVGKPLIAFDDSTTLEGSETAADAVPPMQYTDEVIPDFPITLEFWFIRHPHSGAGVGRYAFACQFQGAGGFDLLIFNVSTDTSEFFLQVDTGDETTHAFQLGPHMVMTDVPHHCVIEMDGSGHDIYVDGVLYDSTTAIAGGTSARFGKFFVLGGFKPEVSGYTSGWYGRVGDVRLYDYILGARRTAHYDAGATPWTGDTTGARLQRIASYIGLAAADVDFDTGATTLGPTPLGGDALSYMQKVALSEAGPLFVEHRNGGKLTSYDRYVPYTATRSTVSQATFTDDPAAASTAYRFEPDDIVLTDDESQIVNEAVVHWMEGEARASDATSIGDHGRKSRTFDTLLATGQEAQSYAEYIVALYKDPHIRVQSITLNPAANPNLWVPALSLRYGDRVTFRFQPQATGSIISTAYWVQGIHFEMDEGVNHCIATFYLTPATDVQFAVWDTSTWDSASALWGL